MKETLMKQVKNPHNNSYGGLKVKHLELIEKEDIGREIPNFGFSRSPLVITEAHVGLYIKDTAHIDGHVHRGFTFKHTTKEDEYV
jgi:hypothetical protein